MEGKHFSDKKLISFDVDGTLSLSRTPIDGEIAYLLKELLKDKKVAIITGGAFDDIKKQVLTPIGCDNALNKNLILLPTNGGSLYIFDGEWKEISSCRLTDEEKKKIINAIQEVDQGDEELKNNKSYGREIQDRNCEITYSALGENAAIELKHKWDPDFKKRLSIQDKLMKILPNFEVKIGGTTSIDITRQGLDKAHGIEQIMKYTNLNKEDILFVGDAVYENGNDYPVFLMGVDTLKVKDPEETKQIIKNALGKAL